MPTRIGSGSSKPVYTWIVFTTSRCATSVENRADLQRRAREQQDEEQRRVGPVHRALDAIEARERLGSGSHYEVAGIVAPVAAPDPAVDVVPVLFPVSRNHLVDDLDRVEPLARLVAVHRRDVEPGRTAVIARERLALHVVRDDDVVAARLVERQALGVLAVERREAQRFAVRLHAGAVEQVARASRPSSARSGRANR